MTNETPALPSAGDVYHVAKAFTFPEVRLGEIHIPPGEPGWRAALAALTPAQLGELWAARDALFPGQPVESTRAAGVAVAPLATTADAESLEDVAARQRKAFEAQCDRLREERQRQPWSPW